MEHCLTLSFILLLTKEVNSHPGVLSYYGMVNFEEILDLIKKVIVYTWLIFYSTFVTCDSGEVLLYWLQYTYISNYF